MPWLGVVPDHWKVRRLGQIGKLLKGGGGSKDDDVPSGVPCVRYGDLYTKHDSFIQTSQSFVSTERAAEYTSIRFGDVLFAGSGETIDEIGKSAVNLMTERACCGGDVILFRATRQLDARYLGYATACRPAATQKATMGRGITVMHIYRPQLKRLTLALPPVPEQRAIARFLDHADRRIRRYILAKQQLIAALEELKRAIIHRAVTGQMDVRTGRPYPAYESPGAARLGCVPEHWNVVRLGKLIALQTGFPFKSEGFTQNAEDPRLLRGVNIAPGRLRWEDTVRWPATEADTAPLCEYRLRTGDIVLGMDRPVIRGGIRVAVVTEADVPSLLLQRVARIQPGPKLRRDFAFLLLSGQPVANYMAPIFTGISVPHLSPEQIKGFTVALPGLGEQDQILKALAPAIHAAQRAADRATRQIKYMSEYRTRLIADVVTGKLDVREAAAALPDRAPA